jgi:hypothetical protein
MFATGPISGLFRGRSGWLSIVRRVCGGGLGASSNTRGDTSSTRCRHRSRGRSCGLGVVLLCSCIASQQHVNSAIRLLCDILPRHGIWPRNFARRVHADSPHVIGDSVRERGISSLRYRWLSITRRRTCDPGRTFDTGLCLGTRSAKPWAPLRTIGFSRRRNSTPGSSNGSGRFLSDCIPLSEL